MQKTKIQRHKRTNKPTNTVRDKRTNQQNSRTNGSSWKFLLWFVEMLFNDSSHFSFDCGPERQSLHFVTMRSSSRIEPLSSTESKKFFSVNSFIHSKRVGETRTRSYKTYSRVNLRWSVFIQLWYFSRLGTSALRMLGQIFQLSHEIHLQIKGRLLRPVNFNRYSKPKIWASMWFEPLTFWHAPSCL